MSRAEDSANEDVTVAPVKKGRGRPRKSPLPADSLDTVNGDLIAAPAKKARGRPRKSLPSPDVEAPKAQSVAPKSTKAKKSSWEWEDKDGASMTREAEFQRIARESATVAAGDVEFVGTATRNMRRKDDALLQVNHQSVSHDDDDSDDETHDIDSGGDKVDTTASGNSTRLSARARRTIISPAPKSDEADEDELPPEDLFCQPSVGSQDGNDNELADATPPGGATDDEVQNVLSGFRLHEPFHSHFTLEQDDVIWSLTNRRGVVPVDLVYHLSDLKQELQVKHDGMAKEVLDLRAALKKSNEQVREKNANSYLGPQQWQSHAELNAEKEQHNQLKVLHRAMTEDFEGQKKQLEEQICALKGAAEENVKAMAAAESMVQEKQQELNTANNASKKLSEALNIAQNQHNETLHHSVLKGQQYEQSLASLNGRLRKAEEALATHMAVHNSKAASTATIHAEKTIKNLRRETETKDATIADLNKSLAAERLQLGAKTQALESLCRAEAQFEEKFRKLYEQAFEQAFGKGINASSMKADGMLADLTQYFSNLAKQLKDAKRSLELVQQKNSQSVHDYEAKLEQSNASIKSLKRAAEERKSSHDVSAVSSEEMANLKKQIGELQATIAHKEADIESHMTHCNNNKEFISGLEQGYQLQLQSRDAEFRTMESKLEETMEKLTTSETNFTLMMSEKQKLQAKLEKLGGGSQKSVKQVKQPQKEPVQALQEDAFAGMVSGFVTIHTGSAHPSHQQALDSSSSAPATSSEVQGNTSQAKDPAKLCHESTPKRTASIPTLSSTSVPAQAQSKPAMRYNPLISTKRATSTARPASTTTQSSPLAQPPLQLSSLGPFKRKRSEVDSGPGLGDQHRPAPPNDQHDQKRQALSPSSPECYTGPSTSIFGFCHPWIRTGKCRFNDHPSGCKFRHEMPKEGRVLREITGSEELPVWWLESMGKDLRGS